MTTGTETPARLLRIRGLVQGVGYRNALLREATRLGLSGWVRNRSDGSVEALAAQIGVPADALAAGPAPALDGLIAWARRGPPAARVSEVSWEATQAPVEAGFYREETL